MMVIITAILINLLWVTMMRKERLSYESIINNLKKEIQEYDSRLSTAKCDLSRTQCQMLKELGYKLYDIDHAYLCNEPTVMVYTVQQISGRIKSHRVGISEVFKALNEPNVYYRPYPSEHEAVKARNNLL